MDWTDLAQDRNQWRTFANTEISLRVSWNAGKFLSSCATGSFARRAQFCGVSIHRKNVSWRTVMPHAWSSGNVYVGKYLRVVSDDGSQGFLCFICSLFNDTVITRLVLKGPK
jgi:hypothetical protein